MYLPPPSERGERPRNCQDGKNILFEHPERMATNYAAPICTDALCYQPLGRERGTLADRLIDRVPRPTDVTDMQNPGLDRGNSRLCLRRWAAVVEHSIFLVRI